MIIGYVFTLVYAIIFAGLVVSAYLARKSIIQSFSGKVDRRSVAIALLIIIFFIAFASKFVPPTEQLYFDENIYQGIALNILHNGNALWCQYGTAGLAVPCANNQIYHDPVEISFYLAMAFGLFGTSTSTAFGYSLAVGASSIFIVFLLASSMFGRKAGIASAAVFALLPELFIWSRTEAVPNLLQMEFAALSFLAYFIYRNKKNPGTMAFFLFALGIAVYVRIEAFLLVPIFMVLVFADSIDISHLKRSISRTLNVKNWRYALLIVMFLALITPEIYYIEYEMHGMDYGSGSICGAPFSGTFSIANFKCNVRQNLEFFIGAYNSTAYYPAYFSPITTLIAAIGFAFLIFLPGERRARHAALGLLILWIIVFHSFYDFFYAGSVTFGVDVRFMLILYPPISIFAGFGIARISDIIAKNPGRKRRHAYARTYASWAVFAVLIAAFAVYPFFNAFGTVAIPTSSMPQETASLTAVNFIYSNYARIPNNCLIFTFTPDVWYGLNRSASQVGYFGSQNNSNFTAFESKFSCFAFDWGYWCNTQEFRNSTCQHDIGQYNVTAVASMRSPSDNLSLYLINNYKP